MNTIGDLPSVLYEGAWGDPMGRRCPASVRRGRARFRGSRPLARDGVNAPAALFPVHAHYRHQERVLG